MEYLSQIWNVLKDGGPIMLALAILSMLLYKNLFSALRFVHAVKKINAIGAPETPASRDAPGETARAQARKRYRAIVSRQLKHARALVVTAPLMGLLGTVIGMLDTFQALGSSSADNITQSVADGISVALTTTQAGLMVAIPALFLHQWIKRAASLQELRLFRSPSLTSPNPSAR